MHDVKQIPVSLKQIARSFFMIGVTGFGGGMAIIAYIQEVVVARKKWMSLDEFSHGVAFGQILGAFSVNVAVFVGYRLRGLAGAVTALCAFMAPSVTMVIVLASLYFRFHQMPSLKSALTGIGPIILALMISAAYGMGRARMRSLEPMAVGVTALVLYLYAHLQPFWILLIAVAYGALRVWSSPREVLDEA